MKFIVVGLGNFGSSLALKLVEGGHEVIGVDHKEDHINLHKDKLTHTLKMDSTSDLAVGELPLNDTDAVIIGIGEDSSAGITTAALFKKHVPACRIVARATNEIHKTIYQAMGIEDIVNPEAEYAHQLANQLTVTGTIQSFFLDDQYEIAEFKVPTSYVGKSVQEVNTISNWNVSLVTVIKHEAKTNLIGRSIKESRVNGVVSGATIFSENDTLILFGEIKALHKMMDEIGNS